MKLKALETIYGNKGIFEKVLEKGQVIEVDDDEFHKGLLREEIYDGIREGKIRII